MPVNNSGSSLSSQTSKGAGSAITFATVCQFHGQQLIVTNFTGSGSAVAGIDVSMDDSNWTTLPVQVVITKNGTYYVSCPAPYPALYARGNLQSVGTGVTGISVSSILASE